MRAAKLSRCSARSVTRRIRGEARNRIRGSRWMCGLPGGVTRYKNQEWRCPDPRGSRTCQYFCEVHRDGSQEHAP